MTRSLTIPAAVSSAVIDLVVPAALLAGWAIASRAGALPPQILPAPAVVLSAFVDLVGDGSLGLDLLASLRRVMIGFAGGAALGLVTGALAGFSPTFRGFAQPVLNAVTQVNAMAWMPLAVFVLGIDEAFKYIIIGWSASVPVTLGTRRAIAQVPEKYRELAAVLGFTPGDTLALVVWPSILPSVFTGLREGLANAWQTMVIVELFASFEGLGYLMAWGRQLFQLELVIVATTVVAVVGFALDSAMRWLERRLFPALAAGVRR